jgi:Family of unknown function (DUF6011)
MTDNVPVPDANPSPVCRRCGRPLSAHLSTRYGLGRTCHERAADAQERPARARRVALIEDLLTVFQGEPRLLNTDVCDRLAALSPDYEGWDTRTLRRELRRYGIPARQIWHRAADGRGLNHHGIRRDDVIAARTRIGRKRASAAWPSSRSATRPDAPDLTCGNDD